MYPNYHLSCGLRHIFTLTEIIAIANSVRKQIIVSRAINFLYRYHLIVRIYQLFFQHCDLHSYFNFLFETYKIEDLQRNRIYIFIVWKRLSRTRLFGLQLTKLWDS